MKGIPYSVIIVDYDASLDVKRLRRELELQGNPQVIVIDSKSEKLGYGAALNKGMELAQYDLVVCMNPDISLKKNALPLLVQKLHEEKNVGIIGPQILDKQGKIQITCSQIPNAFQAMFIWSALKKIASKKMEQWYRLGNFQHNAAREVPSVSGACFAVRKQDWDAIGGADEKLFLYFEEFDLAKRMADHGLKVLFYVDSVVTHFGQVSTNKAANISKIFISSRRYWLQKHNGVWGILTARFLEILEKLA